MEVVDQATRDTGLYCCYIENRARAETHEPAVPCDKPAEWQIEVDNMPLHPADAYTHACSDHVGWLLWENGQHRVFPVGEG